MGVSRLIHSITPCLIAGLLAAASPAEAKVAKFYNNDQLTLLLSGGKVEVNAGGCSTGFDTGSATLTFSFGSGGTYSVEYQCEGITGQADSETSTGEWLIEDSQVCMKFNSTIIPAMLPPSAECFSIKFGTNKFVLYSEGNAVWKLSVSHPQYATKEKLLAALDEVAARTEKVVATRSISEASKDSASWEKVKYSNRVSDFQRYLEEYPGGMFVKLAESQMRSLIEREADPEAVKSQFAGIDFGAYYALIIGINDYKTCRS